MGVIVVLIYLDLLILEYGCRNCFRKVEIGLSRDVASYPRTAEIFKMARLLDNASTHRCR